MPIPSQTFAGEKVPETVLFVRERVVNVTVFVTSLFRQRSKNVPACVAHKFRWWFFAVFLDVPFAYVFQQRLEQVASRTAGSGLISCHSLAFFRRRRC